MKILFVTFSDIYVCSSSNIRNVSLIKGLLELGNSVDIISYRSSNKASLLDESFSPVISGCKVIEISSPSSTGAVSNKLLASGEKSLKRKMYGKLRRLYYSLETVDSLRKIAEGLDLSALEIGEYDLMISSSNPYSVHILADRIRKKFFNGGIKWIQYWGDALYLDTLTRDPVLPFRVKQAEKKLIGSCDAVVYTNGVVLELQKRLFPEYKDKMSFVETPYAFFSPSDCEPSYTVGYFGSYSSSVRDIIPLYRALKSLPFDSIIVGNGDQPIETTDKVTVLPRASVNEVAELEKKTRILVCVCNKLSRKGETGLIPGKVYHYGSTDKEVLVIGATPDVKKFLGGYGRYIFVDNNEADIRSVIMKTLDSPGSKQRPLRETEPADAARRMTEQFIHEEL